MSTNKHVYTTICDRIRTTYELLLKKMGGANVFMSKRKPNNKILKQNTKEEDTMSATARNFVYEVKAKDSKKILQQPAASKAFLEECKKVAQQYRKSK